MKAKFVTVGGAISALYAVLTLAQNLILVGSGAGAVQCRLSEALCVLSFFTPTAPFSLAIGCFFANLFSGAGTLDLVIGPLASLIAGWVMYRYRNVKLKGLLFLLPALVNGLLVGAELTFMSAQGWAFFGATAVSVAVGEVVALALGIPLYMYIQKSTTIKSLLS